MPKEINHNPKCQWEDSKCRKRLRLKLTLLGLSLGVNIKSGMQIQPADHTGIGRNVEFISLRFTNLGVLFTCTDLSTMLIKNLIIYVRS